MKRCFTLGRYSIVSLIAVVLTGCAHDLEVRNIVNYQSVTIAPPQANTRMGIIPTTTDVHSELLIKQIGIELGNYLPEVLLPYSRRSARSVDVIAQILVKPKYKGSGWNFLIEWPGFLIWTPAWHGYVYKVYYDIEISLMDASDSKVIDTLQLPIYLNVRHADMSRTWTEISWLEVSAIAFVSAFVFIGYDDDVSAILLQKYKTTLGDYVAQKIMESLDANLVPQVIGSKPPPGP